MSKVKVKPGACGLETEIIVRKKEGNLVEISIESQSDNIKRLAKELKELDGTKEVFSNFATSEIYKLSTKCGLHLACPVPSGIIKAIEVECGLALPRDVEMTVSKE